MQKVTQRHGITFALSTFGSVVSIIGIFWFLLKPFVVEAVAEELKGKIKQIVASELQPTNAAFAVVLRGQIRAVRQQIASLEFRKERDLQTWTARDNQDLATARADLLASEAALSALQKPTVATTQ